MDNVAGNQVTGNIVLVAFGLYEWIYTLSLLMQHWAKRGRAVYRLSVFAALCQVAAVTFYFRLIESTLNTTRKNTLNPKPFILVFSGLTQAAVLTVGLFRFRYLYSFDIKLVRMATVVVVLGIVLTLVRVIGLAILLPLRLISFQILNLVAAIIILYCAFVDLFLSTAFLNALVKGFGIDHIAAHELIFSSDAKRLAIIGIVACLFGITQITTRILQLIAESREKELSIALATDWSNFLPAWAYIYTLNTLLFMSYNPTKLLLARHRIRAAGFQRSSGLTSAASYHRSSESKSKNVIQFKVPESHNDSVMLSSKVQVDEIPMQDITGVSDATIQDRLSRFEQDLSEMGYSVSPYIVQIASESLKAEQAEENVPLTGHRVQT